MRNVKLGRQVLDHVVANPDEFNMATYGAGHSSHPCRTVACLAGHTLLFSGYTFDEDVGFRDSHGNFVPHVSQVAINLLGLTVKEYHGGPGDKWPIFSGSQTNSEAIERFRVIVEKSEAEGVSHPPAPWPL